MEKFEWDKCLVSCTRGFGRFWHQIFCVVHLQSLTSKSRFNKMPMRARKGCGCGTQRQPVVVQPAFVQWVTETTDTTIGNPERRKRPQRESASITLPSDAHETSTASSHSLTKDDIPTIIDAVIRALPNTSMSKECSPHLPCRNCSTRIL